MIIQINIQVIFKPVDSLCVFHVLRNSRLT